MAPAKGLEKGRFDLLKSPIKSFSASTTVSLAYVPVCAVGLNVSYQHHSLSLNDITYVGVTKMIANELYQFSTGDALMAGVASHGLSIADLLSYGNHGLGTFKFLIGEMIILDGNVYQMKSDGSIQNVDVTDRSIIAPFAMATHFKPTITVKMLIPGKDALFDILSKIVPGAHNLYLAMRMDGIFKSITVRTVGGQSSPSEGLLDVGKHQVSHTLENVEGTLIGFRSPQYMQGISVAGDHLHFISTARSLGGHVLAFEAEAEVELKVAAIWKIHLELPQDTDFNNAYLAADRTALAIVEG